MTIQCTRQSEIYRQQIVDVFEISAYRVKISSRENAFSAGSRSKRNACSSCQKFLNPINKKLSIFQKNKQLTLLTPSKSECYKGVKVYIEKTNPVAKQVTSFENFFWFLFREHKTGSFSSAFPALILPPARKISGSEIELNFRS